MNWSELERKNMKFRTVGLFLVFSLTGCYVPWSNTTRPVVVGVVQKGDVLLVRTCKIWGDSDVGIKLTECQVKEVQRVDNSEDVSKE